MPEFRICTLFSGSSGNCIYAECADGALLIDAGGSGKKIADAALRIGGHLDRVDGLLLSHDHSDHSKGAGILARRHGMPLFMTPGTHDACRQHFDAATTPRLFRPGSVLALGGFHVHTLPTPHDGAEPVAFILERHGLRCGILTDLGTVFPALCEWMATLDAVILESNYDPVMLENGPYAPWLKTRIRSGRGHISNEEAACLVRDHGTERLQLVMLAHLSETNNTPELAATCSAGYLHDRLQDRSLSVHLAPRHVPSPCFVVRRRA